MSKFASKCVQTHWNFISIIFLQKSFLELFDILCSRLVTVSILRSPFIIILELLFNLSLCCIFCPESQTSFFFGYGLCALEAS